LFADLPTHTGLTDQAIRLLLYAKACLMPEEFPEKILCISIWNLTRFR